MPLLQQRSLSPFSLAVQSRAAAALFWAAWARAEAAGKGVAWAAEAHFLERTARPHQCCAHRSHTHA